MYIYICTYIYIYICTYIWPILRKSEILLNRISLKLIVSYTYVV